MFIHQRINKLIEDKQQKNKSLTILMMATEIGISSDALNKTKEGRSTPGVDTLEKIAVYFGVDVNYFFDSSPQPPKEYKISEQNKMEVNENNASDYGKSDKNPWELLYKCQNDLLAAKDEIADLKVENERIKNANASTHTANAG